MTNMPSYCIINANFYNKSFSKYKGIKYWISVWPGSRVSQIAGVFQKIIFESCTLYHIMPFAKIIGPVEKKVTKSWF